MDKVIKLNHLKATKEVDSLLGYNIDGVKTTNKFKKVLFFDATLCLKLKWSLNPS